MARLNRRDDRADRARSPQHRAGDLLGQRLGGLGFRNLLLGRLFRGFGRIERRPAIVADARLPALRIALDISPLAAFTAIAAGDARLILAETGLLDERLQPRQGPHHAVAGDLAREPPAPKFGASETPVIWIGKGHACV